MEKADRQKLVLVILLIAIVAYFGYYGVGAFAGVSGLRAEAAKLQRERDDLRQQVQNAQIMVANLDRIKKEREALELQLREISRRLPGEHESAQVLRSVETLARNSALTVVQVRRRPARPQELYVEIPMEVGVGGGYHDLVKFADQLSNLQRLVTLSELRVQTRLPAPSAQGTAVRDETPGSVNAQLVAVVFQAAPEPGQATPAAPAAPPARP